METKKCCKCLSVKKLGEFSRRSSARDGLSSMCSLCNKENMKSYYRNNKDRWKVHCAKLRNRNKSFVYDILSNGKCVDCGESDIRCLDFDHVPERGKKLFGISIGVRRNKSLENLKKEISKCDIVCSNCHRKRTSDRNGFTYMGA